MPPQRKANKAAQAVRSFLKVTVNHLTFVVYREFPIKIKIFVVHSTVISSSGVTMPIVKGWNFSKD